jgi:hypothetical protein
LQLIQGAPAPLAVLEPRGPPQAKSKVRLIFNIQGTVTLSEERPLFTDPSRWISTAVAQFRFNPKTSKWTLYCADRNSQWHEYLESEPDEKIEHYSGTLMKT